MYDGIDAVMLESTSPFRCFWYFSAYSIASMLPQDCPYR